VAKLNEVRRSSTLTKSTNNLAELDYDKMELNANLNHPRIVEKGSDGNIKFTQLPWGISIGGLYNNVFYDDVALNDFDQLGLGVTLYFKVIKALGIFMIFATLMSLPYMMKYKSGDFANSATGNDKIFGSYSLGNIGQSQERCVK